VRSLAGCAIVLVGVAGTAWAQTDAAQAAFEREDYAAAAALYAPLAKAGNAEAQYRMGMMARFGWGVDKDPAAAARWFERAAAQGHAAAAAELGTMYRLGRGVPEDPKAAARWLTAAATAGVGIAQLSLGRLYRDGVGVERDLVEAYAWFSAAGDNSVMDGYAYRGEIAREMTPAQLAEGRRRAAERTRQPQEKK
jgi:TPR repeat protein